MSKMTFIVYMRSRPKERPGYNFKQRVAYTKTKTEKFETELREALELMMVSKKYQQFKKSDALSMTVNIFLSVPKSWSNKKKQSAINGEIYPITTNIGDLDNHLKSILDACNGSVYEDDRSIIQLNSKMMYGEKDMIIINVEEIKND